MAKLLYGLAAKDTERYMEQLITRAETEEHLAEARAWAEGNGFHDFRVADEPNLTKLPDFTGAVNL